MPSFTDGDLRGEIHRLEQLREELLASQKYSLDLTPDEWRIAKYFHYPKPDLRMPILSDEAAFKLADTDRQLVLLRSELAARHDDRGEA